MPAAYVDVARIIRQIPNETSVSTTSTADIVYHQLAPLYDAIYGVLLQPGRRLAMTCLAPQAGESILEVGVGTGFGLRAYPSGCRVAAIDLSQDMPARAARRRQKHGLAQVTLCRMDATRLAFADGVFDAVYASYVVNVVPDPGGSAAKCCASAASAAASCSSTTSTT